MKNLKEFYILGQPIDTDIGECHFIEVKDFPNLFGHLNAFSLTPLHFMQLFRENGYPENMINQLQTYPLYDLVGVVKDIRQSYQVIFSYVFKSDEVLQHINKDNFDNYRQLIMDMNCIKEEKINPNPEIQKWIEKSKRFKQSAAEKLTFADIVSSIVGYNGLSYGDINEMTLYQLYYTFRRITQIKNYDTSTLFATVSSEKIKIDSWCKHIDLFEDEQHGISREEFNKKADSIFGSR